MSQQQRSEGPPSPILVTGATGNVGGAVVREATRLGAPVRVAVRDLERAGQAFGEGVERVSLDLARPETYDAALRGVRALFLMRPPAISNVKQTLNIFVDRARQAGVEHVAFLSVAGAERVRVIPHYKVEQHLRASGLGWTFLRAGFFMQNLANEYRRDIVEDDRIVLPAGEGLAAWVDARDVGALAARALVDGTLQGAAPVLVGPEKLDFHAVAETLSQVAERRIRYEAVSIPRYVALCRRRGDAWGFLAVKTALHAALRFDRDTQPDPTLTSLLGHRPRDLRSYVEEHAQLWSPMA